MRSYATICLALLAILAPVTSAATPQVISYQGQLNNAAGGPVADGPYLIKFQIYDVPAGGTPLWNSNFQAVTVTNGLFAYFLGQDVAFPADLFETGSTRYLGITVGVNPEGTPRIMLASVPYALQSANSDKVLWSGITDVPAGFADGVDNDAGGDITGVTVGAGLTGGGSYGAVTVDVLTGGITSSLLQDGGVADVDLAGSIDPAKVSGTAATLSETQTFTGSKTFNGGTVQFGDSTMRVDATGINIGGINAPESAYLVDMERNYSTTGVRTGINQELYNSGNGGLYGLYTRLGGTSPEDGGGTRYGVFAVVNNELSSNRVLYGVYGGAGNSAKTAGIVYGVRGDASAGPGATAYGVYGAEFGSGNNYAGYFSGNVNVTGTLSKGAGAFKIDHPLDPENKFLQHSFVESPDMMNIYNGNIVTDSKGFAMVEMPDYFDALNQDYRYQLTVIGQFAQAIVAEKIGNGHFIIQTDKPSVEVSWQVTGIRKDPFANNNRIQVEIQKSSDQRGKYAYPEAYGLPIERGIDWKAPDHEPETARGEDNQ